MSACGADLCYRVNLEFLSFCFNTKILKICKPPHFSNYYYFNISNSLHIWYLERFINYWPFPEDVTEKQKLILCVRVVL